MAYLSPTVEREELGGGRVRVTVHAKPVAYDDGGTLRAIDTTWADSGVIARPHMVSAAKVMVSVGDDGMRRIHPTRELDRYLEIGAPYVRIGGVWTQVSLGTPTRSGNLITWTRPQTITRILHGGHYIKLDIELLGGYMPANRQVAFPVGINGLTRDGLNILRDGVPVGLLRPFVLEDAANLDDVRPIAHQFTTLNGQPYLLLTLPDSTGMARPRIDPTYTDGPSGDVTSSVDTYLFNGNPDKHFGSDNNIIFDGAATRKVLMRFDLSALSAAATCNSATLYLYLQATHAGDRVNDLYMVAAANSGWAEGASADPGTGLATWNNKTEATAAWAGSAGCSTAGTDYVNTSIGTFTSLATDAVGAEYAFALTATTVEDWFGVTNPGMVGFGSFASIASSDHATAGYRPKLVVVYTAGGTTYEQAATGGVTPTGATVKATGKTVAGILTPAAALIRAAAKVVSGALTPAGALITGYIYGRAFTGAITPSATLVRATGKTLAGSLTPAATLVRDTARAITGSLTPAATLVKQTAKAFTGSLTPGGALIASLTYVRALTGSLTPSATLVRQTGKTLAGSLTPAATLVKAAAKVLVGSLTPAATLTKQIAKALAGSLTPSATLTASFIYVRNLAGSLTPSGALVRSTGKALAGALAPSGSIARAISKALVGALGWAGALTRVFSGVSVRLLDVAMTDAAVTAVALTDAAVTALTLTDAVVTNVALTDATRS